MRVQVGRPVITDSAGTSAINQQKSVRRRAEPKGTRRHLVTPAPQHMYAAAAAADAAAAAATPQSLHMLNAPALHRHISQTYYLAVAQCSQHSTFQLHMCTVPHDYTVLTSCYHAINTHTYA
jgi:hypothetical protein